MRSNVSKNAASPRSRLQPHPGWLQNSRDCFHSQSCRMVAFHVRQTPMAQISARMPYALAAASRSETSADPTPMQPPEESGNLSGIWLKDVQASDMKAYQRSLTHCMQMSGLEKETAMRLFEGMQIQHDADGISVRYLTVVPFFKVTESFSFSRKVSMKRRDARPGDQIAQLALPLHRGVAIVLDWGPPLAGHLEDLYTLEGTDGHTLHVRSRINVEGRTNETLQVFRWAPEWRPRFSWPFGG